MRQTAATTSKPTKSTVFWRLFGLDVRSLACLRISFGVVLLLDLLFRAQYLTAHYTDAGTLPRTLRTELGISETCVAPPWQLSLHMLSGSSQWQAVLFIVAALAALAMLVGYRTRIATITTWVMLVSLHARNPVILNGGDDLLRCGLFWAMLLPLGRAWSIDRARAAEKNKCDNSMERVIDGRLVSFATAGLILQLYCMYWFTAVLKWDPSWRVDMTAVHYALSYDHFTTKLGYWLLNYPQLMWWLTLGTLVLEFFGPCLLLLPIWNRKLRIAIPLAFIGLHLGLAMTMRLGFFPAICGIYWLVLLPGEVWDRLTNYIASYFQAPKRRLRVYHPSDIAGDIAGISGSDFDSLDSNSTSHSPVSPSPSKGLYYGVQTLAVYCILFMFWQNTIRLPGGIQADLPNGLVKIVGRSAQLNQYWSMFSPAPPKHGGWLVIKGTLSDGSEVNLLNHDDGLEDERPDLVSATYPNQRWRKNLMGLFERHSPVVRAGTCDYLARQWNETHCSHLRVAQTEILVVVEPTPPPNAPASVAAERSIVSLFAHDYSENATRATPASTLSSL